MVSMLQTAWGYGSVGEIDLVNGGYGNGAYLYSVAGSKSTWMTWTYSTTGHGMLGWRSSSSHWNIIIGGYSKVGCGGWASGSTYYYDCLFAKGGPSPDGLKGASTRSPFNNALPPTPAPKPSPRPASKSGSAGQGQGTTTCPACGSPSAGPALTPDPWAGAAGVPLPLDASGLLAATPAPGYGAAALIQPATDAAPPTDGASGPAGWVARIVAVLAGSGAAVLTGCYVFLSLRRRRRSRVASQ
jgi:hypothetical protein